MKKYLKDLFEQLQPSELKGGRIMKKPVAFIASLLLLYAPTNMTAFAEGAYVPEGVPSSLQSSFTGVNK